MPTLLELGQHLQGLARLLARRWPQHPLARQPLAAISFA